MLRAGIAKLSATRPQAIASRLRRLPGKPSSAARIESLDLGPLQRRHVALDRKADPGLDIREMAVALGKLAQELRVQAQQRAGVDGIEAVLFVDRLPQNNRPDIVALGEEIVEPTGADHIAGDGVDLRALRNRHLGLRDRAVVGDVDRRSAEEMQDAHAAVPSLAAYLDEALRRSLEPR